MPTRGNGPPASARLRLFKMADTLGRDILNTYPSPRDITVAAHTAAGRTSRGLIFSPFKRSLTYFSSRRIVIDLAGSERKASTRFPRVGARWIATGHYARVEPDSGQFAAMKGVDREKDQSYFPAYVS